jgi:hypothetical protein
MSETAQAETSTPEVPTEGTPPAPQDGAPSTPPAEGQTNGSTDEKRQVAGLYISTPEVLRLKIEEEASKVSKTPRVFVRDLLASMWGLTLPEPRTRSTYGSKEEREAAQLAKRKARADLIKQLLAEHRSKQQAGTATIQSNA